MTAGRAAAAIVVVLLLGSTLVTAAPPVPAAEESPRQGDISIDTRGIETPSRSDISYIKATTTMSLTPSISGQVTADIDFSIPENVESLSVRLGPIGQIRSLTGFSEQDGELIWDEETQSPHIEVVIDANRTSTNAPEVVQEGFTFVDTGRWAIVPVPRFGARWSYSGGTVNIAESSTASGEGVVGTSMAYLGPGHVSERTAHGQRFRLVVPQAAALVESETRILDMLARASEALRIGERDEEVLIIAAPVGVDWGLSGLQVGERDAWVLADRRLDSTSNVWVHEYVHTRQNLTTTEGSLWITEATANYYAALLTYEAGLVEYDALRTMLDRGTEDPIAEAILSEPSTWPSPFVPYGKGALVAGAVDRQIRLATGGGVTLDAVLTRLNTDRRITVGDFAAAVGAIAGASAGDFAQRYVQTDAVPSIWTQQEHTKAFQSESTFRYEFSKTDFRVRGPYRNESVEVKRPLVPNETLVAPVIVTNQGDTTGEFRVTMRVNETVVDEASRQLEPGASMTVELTHTFNDVGHYAVAVGSTSSDITVLSAATPTVIDRSVTPTSPAPGESVTLTATLENAADRPGATTVEFAISGEKVATKRVRLLPGEQKTISTTTSFDETGTVTVSIAGEELSVDVATAPAQTTRSPSSTPPSEVPQLPGFGPIVVVLAILVTIGIAHRD